MDREYDVLASFNGSLDLNMTSQLDEDQELGREKFEAYSMSHLLTMSICMGLLIVLTIIGNVFVIAAILLERNLRGVQNYLILSLGVADLMVAALVMPLALLDSVSKNWFLGPELCDIWVSFDVICCTSSILHLVCIALDRYWSITRVDYLRVRNARRILLMIGASWLVSVAICLPPLVGWDDDSLKPELSGRCVISQDLGYTVYSTAGAFYLPLFFLLLIYCKIYRAARSRIRKRHFQTYKDLATNLKPLIATNLNGQHNNSLREFKTDTVEESRTHNANGTTHVEDLEQSTDLSSTYSQTAEEHRPCNGPHPAARDSGTPSTPATPAPTAPPTPLVPGTPTSARGHVSYTVLDLRRACKELRKLPAKHTHKPSTGRGSPEAGSEGKSCDVSAERSREKQRHERERKAARTLAIITGTFVVCWLPFFIWSLVRPFCGSRCHLPFLVEAVIVWLGYLNSLLNPVIYTIFNPDFRTAFRKILFAQYKRANWY